MDFTKAKEISLDSTKIPGYIIDGEEKLFLLIVNCYQLLTKN
jgi:hypothetical protein